MRAEGYSNLSADEHLRILYTTQRWYEDAPRVCKVYLAQSEQPGMDSATAAKSRDS